MERIHQDPKCLLNFPVIQDVAGGVGCAEVGTLQTLPASWGWPKPSTLWFHQFFPPSGLQYLDFFSSSPYPSTDRVRPRNTVAFLASQASQSGDVLRDPCPLSEGGDMHSAFIPELQCLGVKFTLGTCRVMLGNVFNPSALCFVIYKNEGYANTV